MSKTISKSMLEHLEAALSTDDVTDKDFHIRQAEQLAIRLGEDR